MGPKERIKLLLDVLNISASELSIKCGLGTSCINDIELGRTRSITRRVAHHIVDTYPGISYDWLVSGDGTIYADGTHYLPPHPVTSISAKDVLNCIYRAFDTNANRLAHLTGISKTTLSHLQSGHGNTRNISQVNAMRILRVYPDLSLVWLTDGAGSMFADGRTFNNYIGADDDSPLPTNAKHVKPQRISITQKLDALYAKISEIERRMNESDRGFAAEDVEL